MGYLWVPMLDTVTVDTARWSAVERQLRELAAAMVVRRATAADVRAAAGLLARVSRAVPRASTFIRGFYLILRLLGAISLSASAAWRFRIVEPVNISDAMHDISWLILLCED